MKCLILSFYIDMSGFQRQSFVNEETVESMRELYNLSRIDKSKLQELYYDVIDDEMFPHHGFTPAGCLRVLTYCILGKSRKVEEIMAHLQS